ncbi:hypothetical protein KIP88_02875 [Bradyrhizobium sp. SRL28]|uniref:hypothetical protein n=1 Tax=Bradyrhizobium sp. SRL28 TaxID=2836178 RepID=UPI001BDF39DE|nr:hypothetical protein [Bradyrhizobium sp. SRL28]MBT1509435.1 hypothetical protein [Bradyrhizobium sp. SRL28]
MPKKDDEYGLLIDRVNEYGSEKVTVHVVRRREEDGNVPLGCSGDGELYAGYGCPKHLLGLVVDGLGMYGFISDTDGAHIGGDVEFRSVFSSDERKLGRMLKAIKRVNVRIEKDRSTEAGDKFISFAKALKLSFAVVRIGERRRDPDWRFMSIEEGRNRYRQMIEEASAEVLARKVA